MRLLICPVRPGDTNEELRYAARSWEANLHLDDGPLMLWTVGYLPSWLDPDRHIEGNHYDSTPLAVFDNIRIASEEASKIGYKEAIYMNDDFFCLDPVGSILPVRRDCSLEQQIHKVSGGGNGTWWSNSLRLTKDWLASLGHKDPNSYEVHRPLVAKPHLMHEVLQTWVDARGMEEGVPQWRTSYGVLTGLKAYPVKDAKLSTQLVQPGTPWVSTSDQSWRLHRRTLTKGLGEPSRWDRWGHDEA